MSERHELWIDLILREIQGRQRRRPASRRRGATEVAVQPTRSTDSLDARPAICRNLSSFCPRSGRLSRSAERNLQEMSLCKDKVVEEPARSDASTAKRRNRLTEEQLQSLQKLIAERGVNRSASNNLRDLLRLGKQNDSPEQAPVERGIKRSSSRGVVRAASSNLRDVLRIRREDDCGPAHIPKDSADVKRGTLTRSASLNFRAFLSWSKSSSKREFSSTSASSLSPSVPSFTPSDDSDKLVETLASRDPQDGQREETVVESAPQKSRGKRKSIRRHHSACCLRGKTLKRSSSRTLNELVRAEPPTTKYTLQESSTSVTASMSVFGESSSSVGGLDFVERRHSPGRAQSYRTLMRPTMTKSTDSFRAILDHDFCELDVPWEEELDCIVHERLEI